MNNTIKFWTSPRDGKTALWVSAGKFENYNIGDIPTKHAVPEVMRAIVGAYCRGVEFTSKQSAENSSLLMRALWVNSFAVAWGKKGKKGKKDS